MALYKPCLFLLNFGTDSCWSTLPRNLHGWSRCRVLKRKIFPSERWNGTKGFRDQRKSIAKAPIEPEPGSIPLTHRALIKPLIFTVGFSTTTLTACAIWQYESYRSKQMDRKHGSWLPESWFPSHRKRADWRQTMNDYWNNLTEGQKLFAPVLFANVLVFLAWRIPKFQPTMLTFFASNPAAKVVCWPMLLSTFSHYSFFHLAANMYVLHSFSTGIVSAIGKEPTTALYLSAGVISSYFSFLHKVLTRQPGLSVGASGAIMAVLGFICTEYPDVKLSIILLPAFTFSAGAAIKVIIGIDLAGVALGWKLFDHASHLGGAFTGICWALWGTQLWQKRYPLIQRYHEWRSQAK